MKRESCHRLQQFDHWSIDYCLVVVVFFYHNLQAVKTLSDMSDYFLQKKGEKKQKAAEWKSSKKCNSTLVIIFLHQKYT